MSPRLTAFLTGRAWRALALLAAIGVSGPALAGALTAQDISALLGAARVAAADGLPAPDLAAAALDATSPDPTQAALGEAEMVAGAVDLARQEHGRLARPAATNPEWALKVPYDAAADVAAAVSSGRIAAWAEQLRPTGPAYLDLVGLRARYAAIVAAGGWPTLGAGPLVPRGASGPGVAQLRARLAVEGYGAGAPASPDARADSLDPALALQLARFQTNHGLAPTGALDLATRAELDIPAVARLNIIDLNLERERWLPRDLPPSRIEVDIAGQTLSLFQSGKATLVMKVVVGRPDRRTPSFVSAVNGVVLNPQWVVPASIAAGELLPQERRTPGYLARHGFHTVEGQLVQAPGPTSSLGAVKFDMASPFGVYLHDTPARSLFARPRRAFSHGCVRLEAPRELAAALLAAQGWTPADIDKAIAGKATRRIALAVRTPVFIVYRTALADPDGRLQARADIYGWDAQLAGALGATGQAVAHPPRLR